MSTSAGILFHGSTDPIIMDRQALQDLLCLYRHEMAELEPKYLELRSAIAFIRSKLSRATDLPTDILFEVFDHWVACDPAAPTVAQQVCRQWREAVLSYPPAWRRISLRTFGLSACHGDRRIAAWLQRVGTTHLDVQIDCTTYEEDPMDDSTTRIAMATLLSFGWSWKELTIEAETYPQLGSFVQSCFLPRLVSRDLGVLKKLTINMTSHEPYVQYVEDDNSIFIMLKKMPNVWSLTHIGSQIHHAIFYEPKPTFAQHLCQITFRGLCVDSVSTIIDVLRICLALEELSIVECSHDILLDDEKQPVVITHPSLRCLDILDDISNNGSTLVELLLVRLATPGLRQLRLGRLGVEGVWYSTGTSEMTVSPAASPSHSSVLQRFLAQSRYPPVEALQLVYLDVGDDTFIGVCKKLENLRLLELKASRINPHFLATLREGDLNANVVLPNLKSLHLVGCQNIQGDSLVDFVRARTESTDPTGWPVHLKAFHIHVCPLVSPDHARDIKDMMSRPRGEFFYSQDSSQGIKRYSLSTVPPEWDDMMKGV